MRQSIVRLLLCSILVLSASAFTSAGTGVKIETADFQSYTAAGLDMELGAPLVPLRVLVETLGWWSEDDQAEQQSHIQAGLGARLYLTSGSKGLFVEGKGRYIYPLNVDDAEGSTVFLAGIGYRIKPLVGGIDLYASATLTEHDMFPEYFFGARLGF